MTVALDAEQFAQLVDDVFDTIPQQVLDRLDNVVFLIEEHSPDGSDDLLGEYDGLALTERDDYGLGDLPDRIVLYRCALLEHCTDLDQLRHEVYVTLLHEIGHYFGLEEHRLHELGWG